MKKIRILVTGGHLTPALALIEEMKAQKWEVIFLGRKYALEGDKTLSQEYKTTRRLGIPFIYLISGRFQRKLTRYSFFSLFKIPIGFFQSFYWLIKLKPSVMCSFGGYLSVPAAIASWVLKIPIITHEQSVPMGLGNKIIGFFAKKICLSWKKTMERGEKNEKFVLTGNPIRKEIFVNLKEGVNVVHLKGVNLNSKLPIVYITGGNLGSHSINELIKEIIPELLEKYQLIHQCGETKQYHDFERLQELRNKLSLRLKQGYHLVKYIEKTDIGWVLDNANLVIARSGANTVSELAALGKVSILIPLPWAGQNEQWENAKLLEEAGTAVVLAQEKLTPESLLRTIDKTMKNISKYQKNSQETKELVDKEAAKGIIRVIKSVLPSVSS